MSGSISEFLEQADIVSNFVPVDMHTGANAGTWVSMENYQRVVCVVIKGIGTLAQDPIITMQQAQDNIGTGAKPLNFTRIRQKVGATAVESVGQMTLVQQAASAFYAPTPVAVDEAIFAMEIKVDQLDVNNRFCFINLSIASPGANAQLGLSFYIMLAPRNEAAAMPAALS